MKTTEIIKYLNFKQVIIEIISNNLDCKILGLTQDSRKCSQNTNLYLAVKGNLLDGHNYISQAINNGAEVIIVENKPKISESNIIYILVKNTVDVAALIAMKFYNFPQEKLKMIGITGTNGKTSTAFIVRNLLNQYGIKCGMLGTVEYDLGKEILKPTHTTPDIFSLYSHLSKMVSNKCTYCVMEVSSHALSQKRIAGIAFDYSVFTNFSQDHLDYHKSMKSYLEAKLLLFNTYSKFSCLAVINSDVKENNIITKQISDKNITFLSYGYNANNNGDYKIKGIEYNKTGMKISLIHESKEFNFQTNLSGDYQAYNFTSAFILLSKIINKNISEIKSTFDNIIIPGRMEQINYPNKNIFLDYAHTPDALEKALQSLQSLKDKSNGNLIVVFGCGGDRDKDKRPKMGNIAIKQADIVIVTSDNPRYEKPESIIDDILNINSIKSKNIIRICNRKEALEKALDISNDKDIILVAGKGHEEYQDIKGKKKNFSDKKYIQEIANRIKL